MRLLLTLLMLSCFLLQHVMCCCETGCGNGQSASPSVATRCGCGHHHAPAEGEAPSHGASEKHHICIGTHVFFVTSTSDHWEVSDVWAEACFLPLPVSLPVDLTTAYAFSSVEDSPGRFRDAAELRAHLGVYRT